MNTDKQDLNLMVEIYNDQKKELEDSKILSPIQIEQHLKTKWSEEEMQLIKENVSRPQEIAVDIDLLKDDEGKIVPYLVSLEVMKYVKVATCFDNRQMFIYEEGIYKAESEGKLHKLIEDMLGQFATKGMKGEVLNHLGDLTRINRRMLDEKKDLLWCRNGILNVKTNEFKGFSPELMSTSMIPAAYDDKASCQAFLEFLNQVLNQEDIPLIQEMMGYCLYKDYPIHKAFMFIGSGANGKSTLLKVVQALIGKDNTASVSLFELSANRFAPARLFGKLVNIYADIPSTKLEFTGQFKMATGQDLMTYEKKHQDATHFRNYAKLLFSANQLPESTDATDAFFRRWNIIRFPNTFLDEDQDKELEAKLTTETELSGILNWALMGLKRLLEKGMFTYSKTQNEVRDTYIKNSDSLRAFTEAMCQRGSADEYLTKDRLFEEYQDYCDKEGLEAKSKPKVGRDLPVILNFIRDGKRNIDGKKTRVWNNIKLHLDTEDTDSGIYLVTKNNIYVYNSNMVKKSVSSVSPEEENIINSEDSNDFNELAEPGG